jgi:hypothetical protein
MTMAKKPPKLTVVKNDEPKPERKTYDELKQERKEWRITRPEARARVHALRIELEYYREQLEAVPFDIPSGDMCPPNCLDNGERQYATNLVENLNPIIEGLFKRCDEVAEKHGCHEEMDYNAQLYEMKMHTAETGFYIGVLAGAIFAGCPKEQVDRFERGLLFALTANNQIVKE